MQPYIWRPINDKVKMLVKMLASQSAWACFSAREASESIKPRVTPWRTVGVNDQNSHIAVFR
jgi:hypothetical protein